MATKNNWAPHWIELENSENIGFNYFINPILYPMICKEINKNSNALVVDFGAGTNFLAKELLTGDKNEIFSLKFCKKLDEARTKVKKFIGIEESTPLIKEFKSSKNNLPKIIEIIKHKITLTNPLPLKKNEIDVAISRNFLMHLSVEELEFHLKEVSRILKKDKNYIVSFLNPLYEQRKNKTIGLKNNQKYKFKHGLNGEKGLFDQYFKDLETYEKIFKKYFIISKKNICIPQSNKYKKTHSRYYWKNEPMAFVYKLKRK